MTFIDFTIVKLFKTLPSFVLFFQHGITALHLAAWFGCLDIMTLLVQAGAEQKALNLVRLTVCFALTHLYSACLKSGSPNARLIGVCCYDQ